MDTGSLLALAPEALIVVLAGSLGYIGFRRASAKKAQPEPIKSITPQKAAEPVEAAASQDETSQVATVPESQVTESEIPDTLASLPVPVDVPETLAQRSHKLRDRLGRSQGSLGQVFRSVFSGGAIDEGAWLDLEDTLIMSDLGVSAATQVIEKLKVAVKKSGASTADELHEIAKSELTKLVDGGFDRELKIDRHENRPAVVLTVGVNGTGKTTTTGKLARLLTAQDKDVLLGAADTFRAAAAEQLITWGDRVGVPVVRGAEGSDPASVAFEAVSAGIEAEVDVVLIDTAGRLHTKQGLMDELGKVYRVASKSGEIDEVLLVIDATTGQNGLAQAKVFSEVVPVTGVVLSKLDGTAKGGIIVAIQDSLGVPVKLVGLGEGPDDLAPFDPADFVAGLLA
jgi:fused signal recognition particle receptor